MNEFQEFLASSSERLDTLIAKTINISRSQASKAIKSKRVLVDDKVVEQASYQVKAGSKVLINPVVEEPSFEKPKEKLDLSFIYKDEDIAILNKPRGLVVHPAPGHNDDTLVNYLFSEVKDFSFDPDNSADIRPGIVHRIDKDTSGLLAVAMNPNSQAALQEEIRNKDFHRSYLALVYGNVEHPKFRIEAPLTRPNHTERKARVDVYKGREAITHCEVLANNGEVSLLRCTLETGRTHQIRAHLAYIGHPIIGDMLYGRPDNRLDLKGQCLHAYKLSLIHPRTLKRMTFYAPIDDYFKKILKYFFRRKAK